MFLIYKSMFLKLWVATPWCVDFTLPGASNGSELSTVLFKEIITVKFSAVLYYYQRVWVKSDHANSRWVSKKMFANCDKPGGTQFSIH